MTRRTLRFAFPLTARLVLPAVVMVTATEPAGAQSQSIYEATLAEPNQKTPEISTAELRRIMADRSAVILDARTRAEYDAGHVPGAQHVDAPPSALIAAIEALVSSDKSQALVLYCNGPFCTASKRLSEQLIAAGFSSVRRYQLGIPIWRALGGPTEIELEGIVRIFNIDRTAVFLDARSADEFSKGSLPGARNIPADKLAAGWLQRTTAGILPQDDFNTRIVLFGRDAAQARALADAFSTSPFHNVTYFAGSFETLKKVLK